MVSNSDAIVWTKRLLDEEGLFAGVSTGAVAAIAVRIAGELEAGNVVFIAPDDGWKYLSSGRLHEAPGGARGHRLDGLVVSSGPGRGPRSYIRPPRFAVRRRNIPAANHPRCDGEFSSGPLMRAALRRRPHRACASWRAPTSPDFAHVPDPDAAIFLCAVDHRTGYRGRYLVGGRGPVQRQRAHVGGRAARGAARARSPDGPGASRRSMASASRRSSGSAARPSPAPRSARRSGAISPTASRRDYARQRRASYSARPRGGSAGRGASWRGWPAVEAYADPLAKKAFLFAKIAERRGWIGVADPECLGGLRRQRAHAARAARRPRGAREPRRGAGRRPGRRSRRSPSRRT